MQIKCFFFQQIDKSPFGSTAVSVQTRRRSVGTGAFSVGTLQGLQLRLLGEGSQSCSSQLFKGV